jgi:hypothetical protein
MFEESFEDPLQKLQFSLSFYTTKQANLAYHVKRLEKACFRRNDQQCVSEHDSYLLRSAHLARDRYVAQKQLEETCSAQRDWTRMVLEPDDSMMTMDMWLNLHPDCARPYVERYVGLMKEEVRVLEEARKTLAKSN